MPELEKSIVLVGMMGCGKTRIGRALANRLGVGFSDADHEIEQAAGCSINEIFSRFGEPAFREGERKVIQRLLEDRPHVIATGGGAFIQEPTRDIIRSGGVSVWLKVDLEVLIERTARSTHRPLLNVDNPEQVLRDLTDKRHPIYAQADMTVESGAQTPEETVAQIVAFLQEKKRAC